MLLKLCTRKTSAAIEIPGRTVAVGRENQKFVQRRYVDQLQRWQWSQFHQLLRPPATPAKELFRCLCVPADPFDSSDSRYGRPPVGYALPSQRPSVPRTQVSPPSSPAIGPQSRRRLRGPAPLPLHVHRGAHVRGHRLRQAVRFVASSGPSITAISWPRAIYSLSLCVFKLCPFVTLGPADFADNPLLVTQFTTAP